MTDNRKNIKFPPELFDRLKEDKKDLESWPRYFERKCLEE